MTFSIDKNKPVSTKTILVEIDIPTKGGSIDVLLNYEAGIWFTCLAPGVVIPEDDYGVFGYYENTTVDDELEVGSVIVKSVSYVKVANMEELRIQSESFYYDLVTTNLYIHFDAWHKPVNYKSIPYITIGAVTGFTNATDITAYYDDIYFEPRVLGIPSLSKKKDPSFYGLVSFNGGTISFENKDGYFDNFRDLNIYNQPVRIYMGFDGYTRADMRQVFAGFIESYDWDFSEFSIRVIDPRKKLSNPLPVNVLNTTDYPLIKDGDIDKPIPIIYGVVKGVPCKCINPDAVSGDYVFIVMDTEHHNMTAVTAAYIDGVEATPVSYSLTAGTITMARGDFDGAPSEINADVTGADIHNTADIILDLLSNYASIEFIDTYFNRLEYNRVRATAPDGALYIEKSSTIIKEIEQCCNAGDYVFLVQDNGKFTLRQYIETRVPNRTIYRDEMLGYPSVDIDDGKFLSSAVVMFDFNYMTEEYSQTKNTTYQAEAIRRYKGEKSKDFETILVNRVDAQYKSERIMLASKQIKEQVKFRTKTQNVDLEIMDFIVANPLKRETGVDRWAIYEVIGITKDLSKFEIQLDCLFARWFTPEEAAEIQGGVLWGHYLWQDKLYQIAEDI